MPIKDIINRLDDKQRQGLGEVIRFGIVGVIAVVIQYLGYLLVVALLEYMMPDWGNYVIVTSANTIAYVISFIFNYIASTRYTFKVKSNVKRSAGFVFSHIINYILQTVVLNFLVGIGLSKQIAMVPMFAITVPTNFILVRFFLKR